MGFFHHDSNEAQAYDQVQNDNGENREGKFSHELIAGAAAFAAARKYENHVKENGQPANHAFAKELIAGFAGAEADKLIETKGLSFLDKEKAKNQAREIASNQVNEGNYNQF